MPRKRFFATLWKLTKPYWVSRQRGTGLILLATVVGLSLMLVWLEVRFNEWNRDFYNTFETRDQGEFNRQLGLFGLLAVIYIVTGVYRQYYQQMLLIEWRTWLTDNYLADWLKDRAYYRLQLLDKGTDNPDQRIADDLNIFVDLTLSLSLGLLSAVVTLVSFVGILWLISGPITLGGFTIPGYMVWVALVYAVVGTWFTHVIGRRLIDINFEQQRQEANFRFALMRLRENAEGVALYRGEADESRNFRARFAGVIAIWWAKMLKQKQLSWFTIFYAQLAIIFPFFVAAPRFFSGSMPLGGIFQIASAFGQVQSALSWFITAYPLFANWKATVDRLTSFTEALERARGEAPEGLREEGESQARIDLQDVALKLPNGETLLAPTTLVLKKNEPVLVSGPSGAGKSTLFRALAGIWPYWKGRISLPKGAKLLFLPQKPYLPIGTLKHAVCYPTKGEPGITDNEAREALRAVGLGRLENELAREENWAQILSGGEQQRLAFARALLNKPDWLFLDEATASLPDDAQRELYQLLRARLPQTTFVSIGHRASLAELHAQRLAWQGQGLSPG